MYITITGKLTKDASYHHHMSYHTGKCHPRLFCLFNRQWDSWGKLNIFSVKVHRMLNISQKFTITENISLFNQNTKNCVHISRGLLLILVSPCQSLALWVTGKTPTIIYVLCPFQVPYNGLKTWLSRNIHNIIYSAIQQIDQWKM